MAERIPYVNRELDSILATLRDRLIRELPESNSWLETDIGRWTMNNFAAIADMISFVIDRQAAESYIDTVETRPNLVSLLKLIGFTPFNPVPEEVQVIFTVSTLQQQQMTEALVIPKGTVLFASSAGKSFTTTESATISTPGFETNAQGEVIPFEAAVQARQGVFKTVLFTSTGNANQQFGFKSPNIAEGMITVVIDAVPWTQATRNTLVGAGRGAKLFKVLKTESKQTRVQFGDNVDGLIPAKGSQIAIEVFVTDHVNGHVGANTIDRIDFSPPIGPLPFPTTVRNPRPSIGGRDHETIDSARLRFPAAFATQNRAVTLQDYEAQATLVPGVLQAQAVDKLVDDNVPLFNVNMFVIGNDGNVSDTLNEEVQRQVDDKKMHVITVNVTAPGEVLIDILITQLFVFRGFNFKDVAADVLQAIDGFFTPTDDTTSEIAIGKSIAISRLSSVIQNVNGISSFTWAVRTQTPNMRLEIFPTVDSSNTAPVVIENSTPSSLFGSFPTEPITWTLANNDIITLSSWSSLDKDDIENGLENWNKANIKIPELQLGIGFISVRPGEFAKPVFRGYLQVPDGTGAGTKKDNIITV